MSAKLNQKTIDSLSLPGPTLHDNEVPGLRVVRNKKSASYVLQTDQEAIGHFERALRLSPLDPMNFNNHVGLGSANEILEQYDQAAMQYQRALQERPNAKWIYRNLVSSLSGAGRLDEAKAGYATLMQAYPDLTVRKFKQAMVFSPAVLDRMAANLRPLGLPD